VSLYFTNVIEERPSTDATTSTTDSNDRYDAFSKVAQAKDLDYNRGKIFVKEITIFDFCQ
jgi:hypothetical protein